MALAIDTSELTYLGNTLNNEWPMWENNWSRIQIYRACAVGTVIHDASSISLLDFDRPVARPEALDWQPDPDDELDDMEVLYHLNKQAKSSPILEAAFSHTDRSTASTTVMTSCAFQPSSLSPSAQGRPLSSFHRCAIRFSWVDNPPKKFPRVLSGSYVGVVDIPQHLLTMYAILSSVKLCSRAPRLVDQSDRCVAWQLQLDVVDFSRRRGHSTSRLPRRRRSTINPFHRVSAPRIQEDPPSNPRKETKQIRGVRYREDHKRWTAEMKPPTYKNKVHFGEFKSHTQAARVVDVAFHYYGKPLNFSDTLHILEEWPIPANIHDEDKLTFVKEKAKWVSSIYSTLPIPPPSNREVDGEGGDGTSQPQLSLHLEPTGGWGNNGLAEDSLGIAGVGGSVTNTLEAQQGLQEWRPSHLPSYSPTSSLCIIEDEDGEDGAQHSTGPSSINLRSPSDPSCDSHAQVDDGEQVMSGRMSAKRLRLTISAHQFTPPSHQVAVGDSPWRTCTVASPVFPTTFSPCPSDRGADQEDHGMCEPQSWSQWDPMTGSTGPDRVGADGVDGVVTGTLQEQQALSEQNVENQLYSSLRSPSSSIDIRDGEHPGALTSTNSGIPSQFSFESQRMLMDFLMMSPAPSIPSSPTPYDPLSDHAQCLWEQPRFGREWISG